MAEKSSEKSGYAPRLKRPATLDHLKKKEPLEKWVPVVLSDAPIEALGEARKRLLRAQAALDDEPDSKAAEREVTAAEVAVEDALAQSEDETVWVRFRSIGRKTYEALVDLYPPTDEQIKKAEKLGYTAQYNGDEFGPALVAATAIEPTMTVEDAQGFYEEWNPAEWNELFFAASQVCVGRRVSDLGNGSGGMPA